MRTSLYSILCIVIRLGAVFLAVSTIVSVPLGWKAYSTSDYFTSGLDASFLVFTVALLVLAAFLWIYPGLLARIAAGRASEQVFESPLSADELQRIALAVAGIWFAMNGIGDLVGIGTRMVADMHIKSVSFREIGLRDLARLVAALVKVALGVGLAFGARGLAGALRTLREHGLPPAAASESGSETRP